MSLGMTESILYKHVIITEQKTANNRLHKEPQKAGGLGYNEFIIERTLFYVRISFAACEAEH